MIANYIEKQGSVPQDDAEKPWRGSCSRTMFNQHDVRIHEPA